jgi:hypothetical protein
MNYDSLDQTFDVASEVVEPSHKEVGITKPDAPTEIRKDYEYTRGNLYSIIEKGQQAIDGILDVAEQSDMPRAYEVAGQLIKSVSDATDKLMTLQQKLKDVEEEVKGPTNVTNALFVGSTADLTKMIKDAQKSQNK